VVQIDAVVTKDDKHVTDLKAEDFEILEDGKPQTITNFSFISLVPKINERDVNAKDTSPTKASDAPPTVPTKLRAEDPHRTIAIVVDDMGISFESMGRVRKQLQRFVEQEMRPDDLVAIIRTGGEVGALQQFTTDKRLLLRAIQNVRWNLCSRAGISVVPGLDLASPSLCSNPSQPLGSTIDALRFILQGMRKMAGRKSMVILSDDLPVDNPDETLPRGPVRAILPSDEGASESDASPESKYGNEAAFQSVAELAIRSSVVIYGADTSGLTPLSLPPPDPARVNLRPTGSQPFDTLRTMYPRFDRSAGLDLLTRRTGGFAVKNSNDFGLKKFSRDQEGYYLIGYRPATETFNRRFHSIKVRVKRPGLKVRTRSGFYGMTDEDAWPIQYTERDQMNIALMSPFGASGIEVHLTALFADLPQGGSVIRSLIHFPVGGLTFVEQPDGWHKATLNLSCIVFGDNGRVVQNRGETREIRLQGKDLEQVKGEGLIYQYDVPIKRPGAYQFRVAVRDAGSARIGTAREFIDVPELKKHQLVLSGLTLSTSSNDPTPSRSNLSSSAVRRFRIGTDLLFGYVIYNGRLDKGANLSAQTKIFREGKAVYVGQPKLIDVGGQNDMARINAGGGVQLATLDPGEYLLQIIVTDTTANEKKPRTATQWIEFEIVK
jgi:VWFA-related protein